jgi:hypothetical protein
MSGPLTTAVRWRIALLGAASIAVIYGIFWLRWDARSDAEAEARARAAEKQTQTIIEAEEREDEVESLDDAGLRDRLERLLWPRD